MTQSIKISVITVCYNSADTLDDTLDSVAIQNYPDIEHIVIDGGSTDETRALLESGRGRVTYWLSESDRGIYDAMNKGLALTSGDVIGFLNADDVYANTEVLSQVAKVFEDTEVDACYADLVYVSQKNANRIVRYWKSRPFQPGLFKLGWMPAHPTFFVRKSLYEELGRFDLDYQLQSDFELTMRFLEIYRVNAVYVPNIWIKMRTGGASNQSIRNVISGNIEAFKACRKNHLFIFPIFNILKILSRIPQFFSRPPGYRSPIRGD